MYSLPSRPEINLQRADQGSVLVMLVSVLQVTQPEVVPINTTLSFVT